MIIHGVVLKSVFKPFNMINNKYARESQLSVETLEQYSKQWQPFFNANDISQAIIECVKKSQQRLGEEFELKRKVLQFDANNHNFIRAFYQCEPNRKQVCSLDSFFE